MTIALPVDSHPVCADPEYLPIVDAAFERPGGPESHWMRERLCVGCPVRLECLLLGNATGEHGVWGGLNGKERTEAGGRSAWAGSGNVVNLRGVVHGRDGRTDRKAS